jgi:hypothetical protein
MVQKSEVLLVTNASRKLPLLVLLVFVGPFFVVQDAPKIIKQATNSAIRVKFFMRFSVRF